MLDDNSWRVYVLELWSTWCLGCKDLYDDTSSPPTWTLPNYVNKPENKNKNVTILRINVYSDFAWKDTPVEFNEYWKYHIHNHLREKNLIGSDEIVDLPVLCFIKNWKRIKWRYNAKWSEELGKAISAIEKDITSKQ